VYGFALLRLQGCKNLTLCDVAVLNRKGRIFMTLFEELEIEYIERDGVFYPVLSVEDEVNEKFSVGKYGRMWMAFMKCSHPDRYRSLVRFGRLHEKAVQVNEEAYELLDCIERKWLEKHQPDNANSFAEMYHLRMQARMTAEEEVLEHVVRQYH
jgi:hypothetical protein